MSISNVVYQDQIPYAVDAPVHGGGVTGDCLLPRYSRVRRFILRPGSRQIVQAGCNEIRLGPLLWNRIPRHTKHEYRRRSCGDADSVADTGTPSPPRTPHHIQLVLMLSAIVADKHWQTSRC